MMKGKAPLEDAMKESLLKKSKMIVDEDELAKFFEDYNKDWGFNGPKVRRFYLAMERWRNLDNPFLLSKAQFAIEQRNKELPPDKQLPLVSILQAFIFVTVYQCHFLTMKAKEASGKEITCRAHIITCKEGCDMLSEFGVAPYGENLSKDKQAISTRPLVTRETFMEWKKMMEDKKGLMQNQMDRKRKLKGISLQDGNSTSKFSKVDKEEKSLVDDQERNGFVKGYMSEWCEHIGPRRKERC